MVRDLSPLDEYISENDLDGYLIDAPGTVADQRYLTGFGSVDPFVSLWKDGEVHLLVRSLDRGLAREESRAETVVSGAEYGRQRLVAEHGAKEAAQRILWAFLQDYGATRLAVPERFPLARADWLRSEGVHVQPETDDLIQSIRAVKTAEEIEFIRSAQRATEAAMRRAQQLLEEARTESGVLMHDDEPLTSERVKAEIEISLVRDGYALEETIVAAGQDAGDPHERGSGPLAPGVPIVIDIFPRDRTSKYHADMTRTFCVGEPDERMREWYDLTRRAQDAALECLAPSVSGEAVHAAVCDVYEAAGVRTTRSDETTETGFVHGTGHGVGLDIHELPSLNASGEELEPGHVVTVEPGVYDPDLGGIRIEDLVRITPDGYENLTTYEREFTLQEA